MTLKKTLIICLSAMLPCAHSKSSHSSKKEAIASEDEERKLSSGNIILAGMGASVAKDLVSGVKHDAQYSFRQKLYKGASAAASGIGGLLATGAGAVTAGAAAVAGAGAGIARLAQSNNCRKLCATHFVQQARDKGLKGDILWDDVQSDIEGILDKRTCKCTYTGPLFKDLETKEENIKSKEIKEEVNQREQRGPLGAAYKKMCENGKESAQDPCNSDQTVCLRDAPSACLYIMSDDED